VYYTKIYRIPVMVIRGAVSLVASFITAISASFTSVSRTSYLVSSFNLSLVKAVIDFN
jgi:hypothetical protein